jgi:hypothetical protein
MLQACYCCQLLKKRGYKGCLKRDFSKETKALLNELLVKIKSPRSGDYIVGQDIVVDQVAT